MEERHDKEIKARILAAEKLLKHVKGMGVAEFHLPVTDETGTWIVLVKWIEAQGQTRPN